MPDDSAVIDATTFGGLSAGDWDRLAGGRFYSTSAWLRYCAAEAGAPGGAALAHAGDDAACAVPVRELAGLPAWSRYRWNDRLAEAGLPLLAPGGTLVGPPEGFQTHLLGPDGPPPAAAVERLVDDLREASGRDGGGCVAMYVTTADAKALREAGVTAEPVLLDVDAWIAVPEGGWEPWLEAQPAKRRQTARRENRKFDGAGYAVEHRPLSECCEQLAVAAASTLQKYGHDTSPEHELVSLRRVVAVLGPLARVAVLSYGDGEPIGFCLYYAWGDTLFARWVGFEYDRLAGAAEYFNVSVYSLVREAPATGARWIHLGCGSPEAKALRGAELRPLWMVDLAEDSPLAGLSDEVRRHNAQVHDDFAANERIASSLADTDMWSGIPVG